MSGQRSPAPGGSEVAAVLAAAGPELTRLLERTEVRLTEVAESNGKTLARHASGTLAAGGKRLRPILVFLCGAAAAHDGDRLVGAAAAVELLHMATLVHDDVLDRATLRRGRPTVVAEAGRGAATATGDLLFSRAFAELSATGSGAAVRTLSGASSALVRGELMQRADAWSPDVSAERYLERCGLKTASLFEAACRLGALFSDDASPADALGRFGAALGLAFQILDDVLDVEGPTERTGKPRGADLLDGTVTLPLILARGRDRELGAVELRTAAADWRRAESLCERVAATGALGEARRHALGYVEEAKSVLDSLELPETRRLPLALVADAVVERYS